MEMRVLLPYRSQQKNYESVQALWFAGGRQPNAGVQRPPKAVRWNDWLAVIADLLDPVAQPAATTQGHL